MLGYPKAVLFHNSILSYTMQEHSILSALEGNGIPYLITFHPAVHSIDELKTLRLERSEMIAKNLFLREDRRKRYFVLTLRQDKTVKLKELRTMLHCRSLSFASEDELYALLGEKAGAVTPLGIVHDEAHRVEVVFDTDILTFPLIGVHPDSNTATVWISPVQLERFIGLYGNRIHHIQL